MANGGKDIRLGDDKRPVTIIPNSEDNLYNVRTGEILTDEFGIPLTTEIDEIFVADATSQRSTSIVFPKSPEDSGSAVRNREISSDNSVVYGHDLDVYATTQVKKSDNSLVSFASTIAFAAGGSTTLELYPYVEVKTVNDQGNDYNRLYYRDSVGIKTIVDVQVGDQIVGKFIKPGTFVSRVNRSRLVISKNVENVGILTTTQITITRPISFNKNTNNIITKKANNIFKVEEQFKETSEVSSSLLGIPRAETQLSLFSDVSVYGLDPDEFEDFVFNGGTSFNSWENRGNAIYGSRYRGRIQEEVQEAAIRLEVFSAPYSFPFGPDFAKVDLYDEVRYTNYRNFINLGIALHNYYIGSAYPDSWKSQFLNPSSVTVTDTDNVVEYVGGNDIAFAAIDTWTDVWRSIELNELTDPLTGEKYNFQTINNLDLTIPGITGNVGTDNTRPGYSSEDTRYTYLQSRRVFRYQPGRISGFTFGVKSSTELRGGSIIEWGIKNPTDQYLFQIDTGNLKIVRRSTVSLSESVLARSGLTVSDQIKEKSNDPFDDTEYFTIKIPKDKFNGDTLDENGPSGYNLLPEKVTMYKIEFGWYGAIGARFYAYIPTSNGDARWVVMHTLVIENSLSQPCLQDSYFRLFYSISISNNKDLRTPQFLYKYGSSYYIDGGDEGTSQLFTSSGISSVGINTFRTLIGITPKDFLQNQLGDLIANKKIIIPTELNVTSDSLAKIEVITCKACPGYGHVYTPGVASTEFGRTIRVGFGNTSNLLTAIENDNLFREEDNDAKIIAPSIYNAYITELSDGQTNSGITTYGSATIQGWGAGLDGYPNKSTRPIGGEKSLDRVTGIVTTNPLNTPYPHTIRLSNYDGYMASDYRITGSEVTIQFLNPSAKDDFQHFSDFLIGVTDRKPNVTLPNTLDSFDAVGGGTTTILKKGQILYVESTHTNAGLDEDAVEDEEQFTGNEHVRGEVDFRIPKPSGSSSGFCSKVEFKVKDSTKISGVQQVTGQDLINSGVSSEGILSDGFYLLKDSAWTANTDFDGGQVKIEGIDPTSSSPTYVGIPKTYVDSSSGITKGYINISSTTGQSSTFAVEIRPVEMTANRSPTKQKVFNFNPFPLFLVARLRDNAKINNISIKEKIGDVQKTIAPRLYVLGHHMKVDRASGNASDDLRPTNFKEIDRQSSALIDDQNQQTLRPGTVKDVVYVGANSTKSIDMKLIFGQDRNVITSNNLNTEATFITGKKIDSSGTSGTIQIALNFKEQ